MPGTTPGGVPYAVPTDPLVQWPATSQGMAEKIDAAIPVGTIVAYGGSTAPAGWQICDGTAHTSNALAAVIGGMNVPDLRGLFIVGASAGYPLKSTGGAATVTLTPAQMPSHAHGGATGGDLTPHTHSLANGQGMFGPPPGGPEFGWTAGDGKYGGAWNGTGNANQNHTHGINPEGGGAAHENLPPYYALTYIIRLGA